MANNCRVPTPPKYVEELLDCVGYVHDLYHKSVLENSCGAGNILKEIVRRYIENAIQEGFHKDKIIEGLQEHITGYDVDPECVKNCIDNLDRIALEYGLTGIEWNVRKQDYLKCGGAQYQYIIGNPPYITYHDLNVEQRGFLKEHFESCGQGRFDYCYAFIEAALKDLADDGKLAYILPYSILRNKFAEKIREIIKVDLEKLIDFKGIQIFPNTVTSSVIILCDKQKRDRITYYNKQENCNKTIRKNSLKGKWIFEEKPIGHRRFGDFFKVANSVATLCNEVYVFEADKLEDGFYCVGDGKIEKDIVFDAASVKSEKKYNKAQKKRDKIIFPYRIHDKGITHYEENELKTEFPECYSHLIKYKEKLLNRKSSENIKWFEYGRSQAINDIIGSKLIMSMVVTNKVVVYEVSDYAIPYAGTYIKVHSDHGMSLKEAKQILESDRFFTYIKNCGTPTTTSSFRISVKDIEEYYF